MADTPVTGPWYREIFSRRMGLCLVTGFSSGLPLYVLLSLLNAYLRAEGLNLSVIGALSLIMFPYTWKFLWAPVIDRYRVLRFARRKGWIVLTQLILMVSIAALGLFNPLSSIGVITVLAFITALASATQDIAIDALRREMLPDRELGLGNSLFVNAYRVASLIPGGLSLILADYFPWSTVFLITALSLLPGFLITLIMHEKPALSVPRTLKEAVVEPFHEFLSRNGVRAALLTVLFVFLYKLGDSMATALATPFYIDMGYSLTEIGIVAKNVGLWSMVLGGLAGGVLMLKIGINQALWYFGVGQVVTILGFWLLAHEGVNGTPHILFLALVIGAEALGAGLGTAAFVAFIARETSPAFTATQFALLTSFSAVPRTFCNATTGFLVEALGWENFFLLCTALALPGMFLLFKVAPFFSRSSDGTV
ncbi:MAG TPA: AmpG family muropeptide MFS transporter [Candidatus Avisuccinivibrio pullicola]|nr:AmpG family muropeptide MFS transporter [Candidatus Avisuccinivibrio pullicola]